jgi:hypothetical protein
MLAIAWSEEHKEVTRDKPITGLHVGQTDVTLNEMWAQTPKRTNGRI